MLGLVMVWVWKGVERPPPVVRRSSRRKKRVRRRLRLIPIQQELLLPPLLLLHQRRLRPKKQKQRTNPTPAPNAVHPMEVSVTTSAATSKPYPLETHVKPRRSVQIVD